MTRIRQALRSKTAGDSAWALGDQASGFISLAVSAYLLTDRLGEIGYGAFAAVYNLIGPGLAFIQSGVMLAILDRIVREKQDPRRVAGVYLGYVWSVGAVLAAVFSLYAVRYIDDMPATAATLFITTEFLVTAGMWVTTAVIQAAKGYRFAVRTRMIVTATRTSLMIGLAVAGKLNLTWFAITQTSAFVVLTVLLMGYHQRLYGQRFRPTRFGRSDVADSSVYAVGLSAMSVQTSYDQVIMQGKYEADAGRYALAFRIVSLGLMPLQAIAAATHMDFLSVDDDHNDQVHKARKFATVGLAYSVVFIAAVWIAAPIVPRILGEEYEGSVAMMRWLAPLVPLRGIGAFPMNGLLGLGRNRLRTQILVGTAVFSLALYLVLIPHLSWKGGVIGSLVSEALLFVVAWVALIRCQASHQRERELASAGAA